MKIINSEDQLIDLSKSSGGQFAISDLESAYKFCEKIASSHYENFPVGSIFIPKKNRKYFYSVYAFSRIADDIADELVDTKGVDRIKILDDYILNIIEIEKFSKHSGNPIFVALFDTIKAKNLPKEPFLNLIHAFKMDAEFAHAKNMDDLVDYCNYSANPVGELVLRIFDMYDEKTAPLSDAICTGLQLINFWQDFSVDLRNQRCFIPKDFLEKFNLEKESLVLQEKNINFKSCISVIFEYTKQIYNKGNSLPRLLKPFRLRMEIAVTYYAGLAMLEKCELMGSELLSKRPKLEKIDYLKILYKALFY